MTAYNNLSDSELTILLKAGDVKAFDEIFERYSRVLYVYARNMIRDTDEAQDLVQDIFTSLWDHAAKLELRSSLSAYLYSAVRYKFLNLVSRRKVRSDYAEAFQALIDEGDYSTDHYINEKELIALIEKEVVKLPQKMREVFELSRNAGLSHREIALQLGITEKTVKNHVNHALKILRGKFDVLAILVWLMHR
ncbi:RNA polymerase sigma factor [Pedobacter sp. MC2016-24]|uniref:RNA polymerase sigma factor n=1 Tax=Pedobacter sp. MC2016-24 TaxID=2780090 RepID=UPI00187F7236|nr:RNA polymerase sigma-70 factor [Pedobacter sp. MC2016-24]MBE9601392.1 RNA polymerase sigma-70 factor [Pedobacter sp. MC2016-24]